MNRKKYKAITIGVSKGGLEALISVLRSIPKDFPIPLIIAQHLSTTRVSGLALLLNAQTNITVQEARSSDKLMPATVYIAPSGCHLLVEPGETLYLSYKGPVNHATPSIDMLFKSASAVYGDSLVGVVLTGANSDGSQGLKIIKDTGGLAVVQDPKTAEADSMPRAAMAACSVDHSIALQDMGAFLTGLTYE